MNNEETENLYKSLSTVRVMKSRRLIWPGHVASTGKQKCITIFFKRSHLKGKALDGRTI